MNLNEISPEKFQEILKLHQMWLNNEDGGLRAEFKIYYDFKDSKFDGISWQIIDLDEAELAGINLSGAHITMPYFTRANLTKANFKDANLRHADFTGARLKGANFENTDLKYAIFTGANLEGANFSEALLTKVNFSGARLRDANFTKACLNSANLADADLRNANFQNADLAYSNLKEAGFLKANFKEADLSKVCITKEYLLEQELTLDNLEGTLFAKWYFSFFQYIKRMYCDFHAWEERLVKKSFLYRQYYSYKLIIWGIILGLSFAFLFP